MRLAARPALQSGLIFSMRVAGAAVVFVTQAAMARLWGAPLLGSYLLVVATVNLLAAAMPLGFQVIAAYFTAEYRARNDGAVLRRFAQRAYFHVAVVTAIAVLLGPLVAQRLGGDLLAALWMPVVVTAAATALVFVNGALLVGLKHPVAGFIADTLCRPLLMATGFALALAFADPATRLEVMIWIAGLAYGATASIHGIVAWRMIAKLPASAPLMPAEPRRWWRFALPWVVIALATDFFLDLDLLLLSKLLPIGDLAVFGVCTRMFALIAFGVSAIYAVTMPDMFEAEARGDRARFHRRLFDANLIATGFAGLVSCAVLFAGPVLGLFGPSFVAGTGPLAILCLGLTARSIAGPAALVLSIHDKPTASLPPVAFGLAALVLGNLLLVPGGGITGAASAAAISIALWSVAQWLVTRHHTAMDVSIWPRLRAAFGKATVR